MKFKIGDLVRWYEQFADLGVMRDSGLGLVIEVNNATAINYLNTTYKVYRHGYNDTMVFAATELEDAHNLYDTAKLK